MTVKLLEPWQSKFYCCFCGFVSFSINPQTSLSRSTVLIGSLNGFEGAQDFCVNPRRDKPENLPVLYTDSESQYKVQQMVNVLSKGDEKSIFKQLLHLLQWHVFLIMLCWLGPLTYAREEGSWCLFLNVCMGWWRFLWFRQCKPAVLHFQMMSDPPLPRWKLFCKE